MRFGRILTKEREAIVINQAFGIGCVTLAALITVLVANWLSGRGHCRGYYRTFSTYRSPAVGRQLGCRRRGSNRNGRPPRLMNGIAV